MSGSTTHPGILKWCAHRPRQSRLQPNRTNPAPTSDATHASKRQSAAAICGWPAATHSCSCLARRHHISAASAARCARQGQQAPAGRLSYLNARETRKDVGLSPQAHVRVHPSAPTQSSGFPSACGYQPSLHSCHSWARLGCCCFSATGSLEDSAIAKGCVLCRRT